MADVYTAGGYLYHPPSGKVLLHHRDANAPRYPNVWAGFGGHSEDEDGGDPLATWHRELREELGITLTHEQTFRLYHQPNPHTGRRRHIFYAVWPTLNEDFTLSEGDGFGWFTFEEILARPDLQDLARGDLSALRERLAATPRITLVPLSPDEQHAFISDLADEDAAWRVDRGDSSDPATALALAHAEIASELAAAGLNGDQFWAAQVARGGTVGWLWVKHHQTDLSPGASFLEQILVRPTHRRRGHGATMLATLEGVLAASGRRELHLNVWNTNMPGRRLYAQAGYETVEHLPGKRHLRKRLLRS